MRKISIAFEGTLDFWDPSFPPPPAPKDQNPQAWARLLERAASIHICVSLDSNKWFRTCFSTFGGPRGLQKVWRGLWFCRPLCAPAQTEALQFIDSVCTARHPILRSRDARCSFLSSFLPPRQNKKADGA